MSVYKWIASILFLVHTTPIQAQTTTTDSIQYSQQIIRIEQSLMDTIPSGDTSLWGKYLDVNFFITTEDGTRYTRQSFLETFGPLPHGYSGWIKVIKPKLVFHDRFAVISYISDEHEFIFGQELHTTYSSTNTYYKTDTSWKMISSQIFEVPQLPEAIHLSRDVLQKYTGVYQLADTITCTISLEGDSLFLSRKGRTRQALLPEMESVFFRNSDTRGRKIFILDKTGTMFMLERRNGEDIRWKRIGK